MDLEPEPEARVVVNGEPVEGVDPLYVGSLDQVRAFLKTLSAEERAEVSVFTPDRVYRPDEL